MSCRLTDEKEQQFLDIDKDHYGEFYFNFEKSILMCLMNQGKLTREQYERCLENLSKRYFMFRRRRE